MLRRFLWFGGLAGALLPLVLLAHWKLTGQVFGMFATAVWPSSLLLMAISSWSDPFAWVLLTTALVLNAMLYVLAGAILYAVVAGIARITPAE